MSEQQTCNTTTIPVTPASPATPAPQPTKETKVPDTAPKRLDEGNAAQSLVSIRRNIAQLEVDYFNTPALQFACQQLKQNIYHPVPELDPRTKAAHAAANREQRLSMLAKVIHENSLSKKFYNEMQLYNLLQNIRPYVSQFNEVIEFYSHIEHTRDEGVLVERQVYQELSFKLKDKIDICNYNRKANFPILDHNIVFYLTDTSTQIRNCFVLAQCLDAKGTITTKVLSRIKVHGVITYVDYRSINGEIQIYECQIPGAPKSRDPLFERPTKCQFCPVQRVKAYAQYKRPQVFEDRQFIRKTFLGVYLSYVFQYDWKNSSEFEEQVRQIDKERRERAEKEHKPIPENLLDKLIDSVERLLGQFVCKNENKRDLAQTILYKQVKKLCLERANDPDLFKDTIIDYLQNVIATIQNAIEDDGRLDALAAQIESILYTILRSLKQKKD